MNRLIIYGCSGISKDMVSMIERRKCEVKTYFKKNNFKNIILDEIIFIDENFQNREFLGYKVYRDFPIENKFTDYFIVSFSSIKSQNYRNLCRQKCISKGLEEISIISKKADISFSASVSNGCFIANGVYLGPYCNLEKGVIVLFNSIISRDVFICNDAFISANVTITAKKTIQNNVYIGAASLIDASIGEKSVIGSGSKIKRPIDKLTFIDGSTNSTCRELNFQDEDKFMKTRCIL